jgi:2-pyrone-4,6-dicarboxylate lactonase
MTSPVYAHGTDQARPFCPPPDPHPHGPSRFVVPAGAVDTHAHVIGAPPRWPLWEQRSYDAPEATPGGYLGMLDSVGMTYGVLVQVSIHGTDNGLMAATLRTHSRRLRGVAVVEPGRPDAEYRALKEAGVTGLRMNLQHGGGLGMEGLESYAALCREYGWHLQILLDSRELPKTAPRLARLPVPMVLDHMGTFPAAAGLAHPGFQAMQGLVADGAWVKLSAAFRLSTEPGFADVAPMAQALLEAAPDRCLWGSDWPHVTHQGAMPNVGDLLDLLADWAPEEALRHRVLVENPARLYGFPPVH